MTYKQIMARIPAPEHRLSVLTEAAAECPSEWGARWLARMRDELAARIELQMQMDGVAA